MGVNKARQIEGLMVNNTNGLMVQGRAPDFSDAAYSDSFSPSNVYRVTQNIGKQVLGD